MRSTPSPPKNSFELAFKSDAARARGVVALKGAENLTVTPYQRTVVVTVLFVHLEVPQDLVCRALALYGKVLEDRKCYYREYPDIFTGTRQFRMELKEEIPSFLL